MKHNEGVDYPAGEDCPHCPFWKGRKNMKRPSKQELEKAAQPLPAKVMESWNLVIGDKMYGRVDVTGCDQPFFYGNFIAMKEFRDVKYVKSLFDRLRTSRDAEQYEEMDRY